MKEHIKRIAKERGYTLARLASELCIYKQSLNHILNGSPTLTTLQKIADILKVEVSALIPCKVSGFLEYNGKIVHIKSVSDLESVLNEIKTSENVDIKQ